MDDNVVHHEVVFDIGGLVLLDLGLRNLSVVPSFSVVLENELDFAHLNFCRCDLDRVRLSFVYSYGLVYCSLGGLPGRRLLSVKLFSNLGPGLENLGTYLLVLLLIVFTLVGKRYCVPFIVEVHVVRLVAQAQNCWTDFLCLHRVLVEHTVNRHFFFTHHVSIRESLI